MCIQPAMVGVAACFSVSDFDHGSPPGRRLVSAAVDLSSTQFRCFDIKIVSGGTEPWHFVVPTGAPRRFGPSRTTSLSRSGRDDRLRGVRYQGRPCLVGLARAPFVLLLFRLLVFLLFLLPLQLRQDTVVVISPGAHGGVHYDLAAGLHHLIL